MTEISYTASPYGPHVATIDRSPSTSRRIDSPRVKRLCQDTAVMDWLRLRTIVDALLRAAAMKEDAATTDRATAAGPMSEEQEPIHG
jgi:hypothetical protein